MNKKTSTIAWQWILVSIPAFIAMQWALLQLGSMFAGLALTLSGEPVSIAKNFPFTAFLTAISFLFISGVFTSYIYQGSLLEMGWKRPKLRWMSLGTLSAIFIISLSSYLLIVFKQMTWTIGNADFSNMMEQAISLLLLAVGEEAFFRGWLQKQLQLLLRKQSSLIVTAAIFTLLHAGNPSQNWLALPGIFVGGLLLGINYLYTGNLWFGIAFHWVWNFLQGPVIGVAVSGHSFESWLKPNYTGSSWLTGGTFGLEASFITIVLNLLILVLLNRKFETEQAQHGKIN